MLVAVIERESRILHCPIKHITGLWYSEPRRTDFIWIECELCVPNNIGVEIQKEFVASSEIVEIETTPNELVSHLIKKV